MDKDILRLYRQLFFYYPRPWHGDMVGAQYFIKDSEGRTVPGLSDISECVMLVVVTAVNSLYNQYTEAVEP